ncbi:MAG: hypothetical protein AB1634_06210 [Thermodesulfobacteriota bacterium]
MTASSPPHRFPLFDRSRLRLRPLAERRHDLDLASLLPLAPVAEVPPVLARVADHIRTAREANAPVLLLMGAHVLRSGVQRHLVDLLERGLLSGIAMNGAGLIHDFELALIGATTESVARYIQDGSFGLWQETSRLNDIASQAARNGRGLGEAVGQAIWEEGLPHRDLSVLAAAFRLGIPVTAHVGIGYDIVHEMPNCDGGAWGAASYTDFLRFAALVEGLEGGVVMSLGSAVMGPEVFLKALAMARNVASQEGRSIRRFTTLVTDLHPLPERVDAEPERSCAGYYFRPWKTLLVRTVADGGEGLYLQGRHADTVPALWTALTTGREPQPGGSP